MAVKLWILAGAAMLTAASCASISEDSCRAGDWESVGFRDGDAGRSPSYFLNHAEACNAFGIAPNRSIWERGYVEGLKRYCTPSRAYDEGRNGSRVNAVCPAEQMRELRIANDRGLEWRRLDRDIDDNEARIRAIGRALADLPDGDPARASLTRERSLLRLETLRLRQRRSLYRF